MILSGQEWVKSLHFEISIITMKFYLKIQMLTSKQEAPRSLGKTQLLPSHFLYVLVPSNILYSCESRLLKNAVATWRNKRGEEERESKRNEGKSFFHLILNKQKCLYPNTSNSNRSSITNPTYIICVLASIPNQSATSLTDLKGTLSWLLGLAESLPQCLLIILEQ